MSQKVESLEIGEVPVGQFNNFVELKEFASKSTTFKQKLLLKAIKGQLSAENYTLVKPGICAPLAMMWIAQQLTHGTYDHFHRGNVSPEQKQMGIKSGVTDKHKNTALVAAMSSLTYYSVEYDSETEHVRALTALGAKWGLTPDRQACPPQNAATVLPDLPRVMGPQDAVYVSIYLTEQGSSKAFSHALALHVDDNMTCHFFDPNIGAYEIGDSHEQWSGFFQKYFPLVKTNFLWAYTKAVPYFMKLYIRGAGRVDIAIGGQQPLTVGATAGASTV
jgi:hypothetical protein